MKQIEIRQGTEEDILLINDLIKNMVDEMARYGVHAVNDSPEVWLSMAEQLRVNVIRPEHRYLIARSMEPTHIPVGIAAGNIEQLERIFIARPRLHISVVYTVPAARGQGIARQLIRELLAWGQRLNVSEAELNVLVANPARQLYEHLGFQVNEVLMVKKLKDDHIEGTDNVELE